MISKKFKALLIVCLLAIFCANTDAHAQGSAPSSSQMPVLHYAGSIPVQWDKSEVWSDLGHLKKSLNSEFSEAVRQSRRFVVLNDDLVANLWKTAAGRKELEKDYELSAYLSLDISARGDMVILTSRLLSPNLETRLQESDVITRKNLGELSREQSSARLNDLVMRMINRLPVDAHVTSVSGSYVTLSGGADQGIKVGNNFDVSSATIESLHPANGSWVSFSSAKTGSVEVIEVKKQSSIAKITALTHENSIKPGNGILIEAISGRNRFARSEESSAMKSATDDQGALVGPVSVQKQTLAPASQAGQGTTNSPGRTNAHGNDASVTQPQNASSSQPSPPPAGENAPPKTDKNAANADQPAQPSDTPAANEADKQNTAGVDQPPETDNFTATLIPKGSELRTWIGMKMWSISGSASAGAQLPPWIVNSAGGSVHRSFSDTIDWSYGLDLGYGPTGKGNFFAYNLHASGRWHLYQKDILPGADDLFFGLMASMSSARISKETSGGYDMTEIILNIGVHGWANPEFLGKKIEWTGEIFYPLYYSGSFGVRGTYRAIESGSSTSFKIGGYLGERPATGWQYGAAVDYESSAWELAKGKNAKLGSIGIMALARRNI